MTEVESGSVNLVVTSPPYPMIEMWDELFSTLNQDIGIHLNNGNGEKAFYSMHEELDKTWKEVDRVLDDNGIACINIGDATRKVDNDFQVFSNHAKVIDSFRGMGYQILPLILWRKSTNKPNKFMGSGMLPPGAYVTLEHEYILIFRKGGKRPFQDKEKNRRRQSAFFWEERNNWFSDVWFSLVGVKQNLDNKELRNRSAAYPFELAFRLINMYSLQGDTVLDPFLGTGTTSYAAMCLARNSIGYELDPEFLELFTEKTRTIQKVADKLIDYRIKEHLRFIEERETQKGPLKYISKRYGFKIMTQQEIDIQFPKIDGIERVSENEIEVNYRSEIEDSFKSKEIFKTEEQTKLFSYN